MHCRPLHKPAQHCCPLPRPHRLHSAHDLHLLRPGGCRGGHHQRGRRGVRCEVLLAPESLQRCRSSRSRRTRRVKEVTALSYTGQQQDASCWARWQSLSAPRSTDSDRAAGCWAHWQTLGTLSVLREALTVTEQQGAGHTGNYCQCSVIYTAGVIQSCAPCSRPTHTLHHARSPHARHLGTDGACAAGARARDSVCACVRACRWIRRTTPVAPRWATRPATGRWTRWRCWARRAQTPSTPTAREWTWVLAPAPPQPLPPSPCLQPQPLPAPSCLPACTLCPPCSHPHPLPAPLAPLPASSPSACILCPPACSLRLAALHTLTGSPQVMLPRTCSVCVHTRALAWAGAGPC